MEACDLAVAPYQGYANALGVLLSLAAVVISAAPIYQAHRTFRERARLLDRTIQDIQSGAIESVDAYHTMPTKPSTESPASDAERAALEEARATDPDYTLQRLRIERLGTWDVFRMMRSILDAVESSFSRPRWFTGACLALALGYVGVLAVALFPTWALGWAVC
ncbi:MAG: hypothetical protein NXI21_09210 [Alphaproteobacteria bacterium]|nr:hypothetical protein [Alphaproteobacteria bacterium]